MKNNKSISGNIFRIRAFAFLVALIGLFLIPYISVQLNPTPNTSTINVNFSYEGANAELVENEVTSRLEQVFSRIEDVEEIISTSTEGGGSIQLVFSSHVDIEKKRLELAALIRQTYFYFKDKISFPEITYQSKFSQEWNLLTYTLSSDLSDITKELINERIIQPLSSISGVNRVELVGINNLQWKIQVDESLIKKTDITYDMIYQAINNRFERKDIGWVQNKGNTIYAQFGSDYNSENLKKQLGDLAISFVDDRIIKLKDIASIRKQQAAVNSYYRINGKSGIRVIIFSEAEENQILLANTVKKAITNIQESLINQINISLQYDATDFLRRELKKITYRVIAALIILFLFVVFIYPSYFLLIIFLSLSLTILGSIPFFYFLNLELHLYSIAGLTLSLGIVLDNIIIMADHVRKKKNRKIFVALLAANLTTIGAFAVVFLIKPEYRAEISDFISVFSINLIVSLVAALWLVPALLFNIKRNNSLVFIKRKKKQAIIRFNRGYKKYITFIQKRKKIICAVLVLIFGLPFIFLPEKIEQETWYASIYNQTFGSKVYQQDLRPYIDKYLGGTLNLFIKSKDQFYFDYQEPEQTKLYVRATMPFGSTIEQLNVVLVDFENYLKQFQEISKFQTYITAYNKSYLEIEFKEYADKTTFPIRLKALLEAKAADTGAADFQIYGVGRGFSNAVGGGRISEHLMVKGYNYPKLKEIAEIGKKQLLNHIRIKKVLISSRMNWSVPKEKYYVIKIDNPEYLSQRGLSLSQVRTQLNQINPMKRKIDILGGNQELLPMQITSNEDRSNYFWEANEVPNFIDSILYKNKNHVSIQEYSGKGDIIRKNQEYQLLLEYDFIGNRSLAEKVKGQKISFIQQNLPIGYQVVDGLISELLQLVLKMVFG